MADSAVTLGAATAREESAEQEEDQAWGGAAIEHTDELGEPGRQQGGKVRQWHGRLLGAMNGNPYSSSRPRSRISFTPVSGPCVVYLTTHFTPNGGRL